MFYAGERNYGCRFLEISIFGLRAIILENEKIRTVILLDKGTEIIELNHKETDTDVIWRSPQGLDCLKKLPFARKDEQFLTDYYTGGCFELFPNTGGACTYQKANMPSYGEVCYLPWEYAVIRDDAEEVSLKCRVRTTKMPFLIEKVFTVQTGVPALFIKESVKNLGRTALHYQWGYHPNFGANFIDDSCEVDIPGKEVKAVYTPEEKRIARRMEGMWPLIQGVDGSMIDLRKVYPPGQGFCDVMEVYNLSEGRTTVKNHNKRLRLDLEWDLNMFRHSAVWHVSNGEECYPRYGDTYVLGFILHSDSPRGLEKASAAGTSPVMGPGESAHTWFTMRVDRF